MFVSLKLKIFIVITTFFTVVLTINMFYDLNRTNNQFTQYLQNLNESSAKLLSANVKGALYNLNYTSTKNTIDTFDNEFFKNIYVLNENGYIFAQRNLNEISFESYENFDKLSQQLVELPFVYFQKLVFSNKTIGYLVIENDSKIVEEINREKEAEVFQIFIVLIIVTLGISFLISVIITKPIHKMIKILKNTDKNSSLNFEHSNDEFGYLSKTIEKNHNTVQELNKKLEEKVRDEVEKNTQKDQMLQSQGLRASMGEMMDAIAHQWVQPLNMIGLHSQDLAFKAELEGVNEKDVENSCSEIQNQIEHLTQTLDEFRSFFRLNKKPESVLFKKHIENTLALLKNDLISNKINVLVDCSQEEVVNIIPNEFKHVMINLITNAKDAFVENNVEYRSISIEIFDVEMYDKDKRVIVNIKDNAGGIASDIIENIFEANVTTKEEGKGTGIGLYMTKLIIEKIGGTIEVKNVEEGACFTISLKV